jgi:competence protein ComEA
VDKRRLLVAGILAVAACAAVVRAAHPAADADAPVAALQPASPRAPLAVEGAAEAPRSSPPPVVVYVAGEVRKPGVYRLPASARVDDAVRAAGGPSAAADPTGVNLAEHVRDGAEIVVPAKGAAPAAPDGDAPAAPRRRRRRNAVARAGSPTSHAGARSGRRTRKPPPDAPVDVNAADAAVLETIPGIGPRLAARIVEFREVNGPFASPDELLDVNGVSERLLDEITPYVKFGS